MSDPHPVKLAELTQLWWFADGAIMDGGTRRQLRQSWGLCTRHAWLYFRVEVELRVNPLGNAVLFADLIGRAAGALHRSPRRRDLVRLTGSGACFTCDYVASNAAGRQTFADRLRTVNSGTRTADWCLDCRDVWQPRECPECAGRPEGPGVLCRPHLVSQQLPDPEQRPYLRELAARLVHCEKSMTVDGPARSPNTDAALVEALGWCSGWSPELALARWTQRTGELR